MFAVFLHLFSFPADGRHLRAKVRAAAAIETADRPARAAGCGLFATAALLSAIGSVLGMYGWHLTALATAIAALGSGAAAVASLAGGCVRMVAETRLAVNTLREEAGTRSR